MKKAAIAGCGGIAALHGEILSALEGVSLTAFADIKAERAEAFAKQFGGRAYSSLEALLKAEEIDVLHICTPHYLHTPMAELAAEKGIAVFSEKPPVISSGQWKQFCALQGQIPVGICFQNRYNRSVCYIKELLASGRAGAVKGARATVFWDRDAAYYTESGWRGSLATEGGGVLINQAVHTLDLLVQFLGRPTAAEASMANHHLKGVIEVEDTLEAYLEFDGIPALFYATTAYCGNAAVMVEICCEHVTLHMEDTEVSCIWDDGKREQISLEEPTAAGKSYWGSSHKICIQDFYRCLEEKKPFGNDIPGVEDTVKLLLGVYKSAREHIPVRLG